MNKLDKQQPEVKRGRPFLGETRKVSLTLLPETWEWIDDCIKNGHADSRSQFIREVLESAIS